MCCALFLPDDCIFGCFCNAEFHDLLCWDFDSFACLGIPSHTRLPLTDTIVLDTQAPVTTPNPAPGTYNTTLSVSLTTNEPATIYDTTDGTKPTTTSPIYGSPIVITISTTTNFFAVDAASNPEAVKSAAYVISISNPLSITTTTLAFGTTGKSYSQTLSATGGKKPYVWSISAGSLPSGLSLDSSTGVISGKPISAGTSTFTVQVKDANNATSTKPLSIAIYAPLTISTESLPTGTAGIAYSQTLAARGSLQPYVWSTITGTLPAGLSLNSSTGVISGTQTSAGTSTFTTQVKDANNSTSSRVLANPH